MSRPLTDYGVPQFSSISEANTWIYKHIGYDHSRPYYWQTPEQTLQREAGDCKDLDLLLLYIAHIQFGTEGSLIIVSTGDNTTRHAVSMISEWYYDPTWGGSLEYLPFTEIETIPYYSAVSRASTYHFLASM